MQDTHESRQERQGQPGARRAKGRKDKGEASTRKHLEKRETDLRRILDDFPNEIYILDAETLRILQANRCACENLGYSLPELCQLTAFDLQPEVSPAELEKITAPLHSGAQSKVEFTTSHRRKDGSLYPMEVHLQHSRFDGLSVLLVVAIDMTLRMKTEEALRKSEQRYRALVERMNEGIVQVDNRDVIQVVNERFCEISGYSADELIGKIAHELLLPKEERPAMKQKLQVRKSSISEVYELRLRKKNGEIIWVQISGTPVLGEDGTVLGSIGLHMDITERKRVEQARRESEERYRRFFEEDLSGDFISTPDGKLLDCNQAFATMLGFRSIEDAKRANMETLYPSKKHREAYLAELREKKKIQTAERELVRRDGRRIQVVENVTGQFENGELVGLSGYVFDITKRKKAEQALRESEQRYRDLFDNAPDMYLIIETDGTILDVNQKGRLMLGYEKSILIGENIMHFLHHDDLDIARNVIQSSLSTHELPRNIEVRFIHRDGRAVWFSIEFSLLRQDDGTVEAIRVVCRDITERKRLEEELSRSHRLESAGRVAGQIAHDFNNLLAPLVAYPALIRADLKGEPAIIDLIDDMESAAKKIAEINQQLLALGRRGHYTREPINLNDLIDRVLIAHYCKEMIIRKELAPDLLPINGGGAQLTRMLTNLVQNANEAMQGMGVLTVKTENVYLDKPLEGYRTITRGEYVKLSIADQGTGIEPEIIDKIFEPFFTTKKMDRMRGSGLGLSIVHGIVEDHQGYIIVDTTLGQGTTFSVYFPITREKHTPEQQELLESPTGTERVLIVDDDPLQRKVIGELLSRLGYRVEAVNSGEEAVAHLKTQVHDLIIIDMVMGGIDGTETYRQICEIHPGQKAIIFSGFAMSQRVEEAIRLGANGFLAKPVHLRELASKVRGVLDGAAN